MFDWHDYEMRAARYTKLFRKATYRGDIDTLAGHLVEASGKRKHKEPTMDRMTKNVRAMGEHVYTKIVGDYAKQQYPELSRERAFVKIFVEDSDAGAAIRRYWQIAKQGGPAEDEERDDERDDDALKELEELAEQERRRSGTSKAVAFTKVYEANPELAAKERRQNRPRA